MLYWHEGEYEIDPEAPQCVTLWEPLETSAPEDAKPYCYLLNDIDFWRPEEKYPDEKMGLTQEEWLDAVCYDRRVKHYATTQGFGRPVLVYVQALKTWYELGLGRVIWRKGRWYFRHHGRKNTEAANFANSGMPGWLHCRHWQPKHGEFVPYADKARAAIEATERKPSRLTTGDIDALITKTRGQVHGEPVRGLDLGGLLVALEDLKALVEVSA